VRIYFVTFPEAKTGETLSSVGNVQRLLSYFFVKPMPGFLKKYVPLQNELINNKKGSENED